MKRFDVKKNGWTPEAVGYLRENWGDLSITTGTLGRELGCSAAAVRHKRAQLGLPARPSPLTENSVTRHGATR